MPSTLSDLHQPKAQAMVCFPASFAQQRLWFIDQLTPGRATYNLPGALRVRGKLDVEVLERALQEVARRHETLRTRFVAVGGEPQQVIEDQVNVQLPVLDLTGVAGEEEREAEAMRLAQEEARTPFNLKQAPLFRGKLLRLGALNHVLLFTMHHIISDAWSMGVLMEEVSILYGAFSADQPSPLPDLPIQYADYAVWQREWLEGEVLERQLAYWKQQLAGIGKLLLPTDRPRPISQSQNGATCSFVMDTNVTQGLKKLAEEQGATLFMVLLAAFQTLLYRYSGQDDIAVGTPTAGRSSADTESLIGFFINTLALRGDLSGAPSFTELIQRAKDVMLDAYAHEDIPFEKLVEVLSPERNLGSTPLFQVMIILQNAPRPGLQLGAATLQPFDTVGNGTSKFDLTLLHAEEEMGRLAGSMEYDTDLFEAVTVQRMMKHYSCLIASIISAPETPIASLAILSPQERGMLLRDFNATAGPIAEKTVIGLFEEQVERTPGATAVRCEGATLTYLELDSRANQLGHYLKRMELGPETRVGICLNRGLNMIVLLLGVLKAGGAYVPLDPSSPVERLSFMLEQAQIPVLITESSLRGGLPMTKARIVSMDEDWKDIATNSTTRVERWIASTNLAYVIYTSGSTGQPKGVAVTHQGMVNYVNWAAQAYKTSQGTGSPLLSSLAFDLTVTSIYPALLNGGCVEVLSQAAGMEELAQLLESSDYSLVKLTPSHLRMLRLLLESRKKGEHGARVLVIGGEALKYADLELWRTGNAKTRLINEYGPTETVVGSAIYEVQDERHAGDVPVGRPIVNTQIYVLDANMEPVPVGVPGELFIAGVGLARGYMNRADLTAERFLANPYGEPGTRMYSTGDLARWRQDGNLEYLGRNDHQVKIRGFRIEPGEIEAALQEHAGVQQAVVMVRENESGEKQLVAYVVPEQTDHVSQNGERKGLPINELREQLLGKLPEYMVPSAFVQLEKIPLNQNGKIDSKNLPQPGWQRSEQEYLAPRNATEETLCRIWQDVLRRERVGVHDNFFNTGGHSLLAAQVTTRIRGALNVDIPLRSMFESPTIAQLAGLIDQTTQSNGSNGVALHRRPAINRVPRKAAFLPMERIGFRDSPAQELVFSPASFAQQSLWLIDQLTPGKATYNMPSALRILGELDVDILKRTVAEIVRRHETLRTSFVGVQGEPQQVIEDRVNIELPVNDLTFIPGGEERDAEALRLAREEAMQPFNLQQVPLFRARLLRLGELNHVLLLTTHHIISDGWSMGLLIQEVSAVYGAFSAGRLSPLPELPIQYADYAVWQREWLEDGVLEQQLAYWKRQLAETSMLALPTDRPRSAGQSQNGALYDFALPASLTQKLKKLADEQGATLFMVMLAAFQMLLYRYSGQTDIAVGTPIAGRNNEETEKLIGYFINTLVLRVPLSGSPGFRELVQRTKEVTLEAYAHQDVPFEKLVEALAPERNLDSTPLFQVMLVLQNVPQAELYLGGAKLQPLNSESGTAKFELTMVLAENAGTHDGMSGTMEYDTDLFEKSTISRMVQHFQTLLEAVTSESDRAIDELILMQETERQQLLVEWNDTAVRYGGSESLQELFQEQVRKNPQATAVQYEGQQLTYEGLNRRANQLAYFLRKLGVGPEVRVGICVQRSFEMIVGLLGVLSAGGTYVPLDPDLPQERLSYVLKDAQVTVLLIHNQTAQSIPATEARVVHLNDDWKKIEAESWQDPPVLNLSENAAFVIYTSGSTGKPKGVVIPHRAICNLVRWVAGEFHISSADRFLHKTSLSFDVSAEEIFVPLTTGARVVLAKPGGERDLDYLAQFVEEEAITCLDMPPALLQVLLQSPQLGLWESVRLVLCGGEAVSAELVKNFYERYSIRFVNVYGPTETTVQSTFAEQLQGKEVIPIGRPVANTQVYVLDERYAPVPVGVVGELLIGGSGLARGYGNRPELTAEKFVPSPFAKTPGERLYRTGDRVRWLADGALEFMGRSDHQVKLRGYRIELGEIESALESHPNVTQSVVLAREDQAGSKHLVAYVIKGTEVESPKPGELEEYLKARLPEYMVPAVFVELEKWPLSHNGKIDRKRLPQPDLDTFEQECVGPRNPTEETLCHLWQQVLQRERVGIQDNFFKIGGHSLRAAQVIARMRESFKVEIPLRRMFELPTISQLAQAVDQAVQTAGVNGAPSPLLPNIKRMARKAAQLPIG